MLLPLLHWPHHVLRVPSKKHKKKEGESASVPCV